MKKEFMNLLSLSKYCRIMSHATDRLYIDQSYSCYLFDTEREAGQFCDGTDNTYHTDLENIRPSPFLADCYGIGIERIRVKKVTLKEFQNIPLSASDVRRQYYNPAAQRPLLRLKQTRMKKYLDEMADISLLCAVMPDKRREGQYPALHYAYARFTSDPEYYYLLFTTIQEFSLWNEEQKNIYSPVKTSPAEFSRVRKTHPVLINPASDRLILTDRQLSGKL